MRQRFLLIAALLLLAGGLSVWLIHEYVDPANDKRPAFTEKDLTEAARKHYGQELPALVALAPMDPSRSIRLAIGSLGLGGEESNRRAGDLVLAQLTGAKGLELVERQELDVVLREMSLNVSGLVRAQDAIRVGKLLRVDWFLLGSGTSLNGTNYTVVRIVDAQTGVVREAGVFEAKHVTSQLASALAGFVRQCRLNAAEAKSPVYLSVGAFEDLSVNSRRAALPSELRSYLIGAYQSTKVTLLEREFASTLLQEMRLDLAGLTDEAGSNAPAMQAAYWMVEGYYQSYESAELEVELVLNVQRMFGRKQRLVIREKPGEPLFQRIKQSINEVMSRDQSALVFSRMTEVRAQLFTGKELAGIRGDDHLDYIWVSYQGYGSISQNEMARRIRNTEEAVRAFETVLLLDPDNREARMCLATCFRRTLIQRMDEARDYYREIIDAPVEDRWTDVARKALLETWRYDAESQRQWLENAARSTPNPSAAEFYRIQARRAAEDVTIRTEGNIKAEELAEIRLFERIKSFDRLINTGSGTYSVELGMDAFASALGNDKARVAQRLADLFPKMKEQFPSAAPHLLATIVSFQVETNAPIIAEFERTLEWCVENADKLPRKGNTFWSHVRPAVYEWALQHHRYDLAAKILEAIPRAALVYPALGSDPLGDNGRIALAYAYHSAERWKEALGVFETFGNRPVRMSGEGPWGKASKPVLTSALANQCRVKLGLPVLLDPREFQLSTNYLCLHAPSAFAADAEGLWVAVKDQLISLGFDGKTNLVVALPSGDSTTNTALSLGASNIWIATDGAGLIEYDKGSRQFHWRTVKDGLLMDSIAALLMSGNNLWIGYGSSDFSGGGGGLGYLELGTRRMKSFTLPLSESLDAHRRPVGNLTSEPVDGPTRRAIKSLAPGLRGEVYFATANHPIRRFRPGENLWQAGPFKSGSHMVANEKRLYSGGGDWNTGSGLKIWDFDSDKVWNSKPGELPTQTLTTLLLDGQDLWIGGIGFVALAESETGKVRKIAYVPTDKVERIQIGGGYVWVQYEGHLHRALLSELR